MTTIELQYVMINNLPVWWVCEQGPRGEMKAIEITIESISQVEIMTKDGKVEKFVQIDTMTTDSHCPESTVYNGDMFFTQLDAEEYINA